VNHITKKVAAKFNVTPKVSAHWFCHAHTSDSLDRGPPLSVVAATLCHHNISTTSTYSHAKPGATDASFLFWVRASVAERKVSTTLSIAYSVMSKVNWPDGFSVITRFAVVSS